MAYLVPDALAPLAEAPPRGLEGRAVQHQPPQGDVALPQQLEERARVP